MVRAFLLIHTGSIQYISGFTSYLSDILCDVFPGSAETTICDRIDDVPHSRGIVFVIGENFGHFKRRLDCIYILLNFSMITFLGSPMTFGLNGARQIIRKRRMLLERISQFDVLLDFFEPQSTKLRNTLSIPVMTFLYGTKTYSVSEDSTKHYDVCFVGGVTPRRRRIIDAIRSRGFSLSPHSGQPIEQLAARSFCCLNVHSQRSNHLEIPRIIGSLSVGCPVISELSFGLEHICDEDFVLESKFDDIASSVEMLLRNRKVRDDLSSRAATWYYQQYAPRSMRHWKSLCEQLKDIFYQKR